MLGSGFEYLEDPGLRQVVLQVKNPGLGHCMALLLLLVAGPGRLQPAVDLVSWALRPQVNHLGSAQMYFGNIPAHGQF